MFSGLIFLMESFYFLLLIYHSNCLRELIKKKKHKFKPINFPLRLKEMYCVVQWLGCLAFIAESLGSIPCQGTKLPQAKWHGQKQKRKTHKLSYIHNF